MPDKPYLPPGVLPNITDTDPPPIHPATVFGEGGVTVDEKKLAEVEKAEKAKSEQKSK